jgi:acetyltransferase-like isoleucine patch superfamily enzyme
LTNKISATVKLGQNVRLADFINLYGCEIGDDCTIGTFVEVQCDARIGSRVKIQSHSFICSGVTIEDEAFIGHGVMFTNDIFPRASSRGGGKKTAADWTCTPTHVHRRASIGSNATILCGVSIGEEAIVGAGSVVTHDVPPRAIVAGNPARVLRYIAEDGVELE